LLGTGTPNPDPNRCGSGTSIEAGDGWILVDCGRGISQRIAEAGLNTVDLRAVLLTHHHTDHVSDLASVAILRWTQGASTPLIVVAASGPCSAFARRCLDAFDDQSFYSQADPASGPRPTIEVREFRATDELQLTYEDETFRVESVLVDHHPIEAAVGYRVTLESVVVAVSGDTATCDGVELLATEADLLIHEALRASLVSEALLDWNASAESVGRLAQRAAVKRLILTHLLPAPSNQREVEDFVADARRGGYAGPVSVAHDLMSIDLAATEDHLPAS
jgi:ribonuclease Z